MIWGRLFRGLLCMAFMALSVFAHAGVMPVAPAPTPPGTGRPAGDPSLACTALKSRNFTQDADAAFVISQIQVRSATADMPAHCLINGTIAPATGFRMWLPLDSWNSKMSQSGCGGRCGDILDDGCQVMIARGYACIASDLGHKGTQLDIIWAARNPQAQIDFGFRSTHIANIAGRALVQAYYGRAPRYVYYVGASTGGRQGLVAAQRFPNDFDGIIAGEPAMGYADRTDPSRLPAWPDSVVSASDPLFPYDSGRSLLSADALRQINAHVIARCDLDDGLKDGIISDPRQCHADPAELACQSGQTGFCLTDVQVAAVRAVYAAGPLRGSEKAWIGAFVSEDGGPGRYGRTKSPRLADPYATQLFDATNPDLRPFMALGHKIIVYQGWADEATFPLNPVYYYESVERLIGPAATRAFFRLFMIPGQAHFPTNGGAETVDYLSYLEAWVERHEPPDTLLAVKLRHHDRFVGPLTYQADLTPANVAFSRPVYPYPVMARYRGGDPDSAASFGPDHQTVRHHK